MLYVGKCPPKTQQPSTKEKSSGDWKTPDKKRNVPDKKQIGRSGKPRTPQMDRKKIGKKAENEKKPVKKGIQYGKVCLFVRSTYLST